MATSKSGSGSGKKAKDLESIKHLDKRANIPTEELRDFVASDELNPTNVLYPRDPSLDPQLVWKGKDEQDSTDLQVPVVPIYIQEKVHPQAIIDDLISSGETPPEEWTLFSDFNGGPKEFDKKIKTFPAGKLGQSEGITFAKKWKKDRKDRMGLLTITHKIDSKTQRRIQCNLNYKNYIKLFGEPSMSNIYRSHIFDFDIES